MTKPLCLLFLTILGFIDCLHLKEHQFSSHLQSFNSIEEAIINQIKQLNNNKDANNKKISEVQNIDEKISLLEAYLEDQRKIILNIITKSNVDLNTTHYECPIMSQNDKTALSSLNQNIYNAFTDLSKINIKQGTDFNQNIIKKQINDLLPNIQNNNLPIYAKSTQVDAKSYHIYNSPNINYGMIIVENTTIDKLTSINPNQQFVGKYKEICPITKPYPNKQGECIACPFQKHYYLFDTSQCVPCQSYDQQTKKCLKSSISYFTNFNAGNSQILLADNEKIDDYKLNKQNLPLCAAQTPFFNGNSCVSCANKLYFSLKDGNCQTCPSGKFYNSLNQRCQTQLYFSNLNNLQWQTNNKQIDDILQSITIKRSNQSYTSCPLNLPFSIEQKCINCENGAHFSYDSLTCVSCSNETKLNWNMHKCVKPGNLNFQTNPLNTSNLIYNGRSINEWMNTYYQNLQKYSGIVDCPSAEPNFDGLSCVSCPHSHPYFNLQLLSCQACEGTTLYDASQHQCVSGNDKRPVQTPSWEKMAAVVFTK